MALPCNNLNLNLYRVFYTVAKTKSFSESSRILHISQPAISKHIQNLEYELNTLLFYRTNRGIEPTPEAKALFEYVEKAYNFLMLGEKQLQESKELMHGKISIGVPTFISIYYLNEYIKSFMQEHPKVVIKMANGNNNNLLELLYQHTLDILILPSNISLPKDFKTIPLNKEKYCFAYNKSKLTVPPINNLQDLCAQNLLLPIKTNYQRKKIEELFNNHGLTPEPIMELDSHEMMMSYIIDGLGVGYILEEAVKRNPNLEKIDLDIELPNEKFNLVFNETTLTTSSKEFIHLLTKE